MIIHIEDLRFKCIIGILDFERQNEQEVIINTTIKYDYSNEFINYAQVVEIIKTNMIKNKYLLIEDSLNGLKTYILKKFHLINSLDIKITKPSILPDCKVSVSNTYS